MRYFTPVTQDSFQIDQNNRVTDSLTLEQLMFAWERGALNEAAKYWRVETQKWEPLEPMITAEIAAANEAGRVFFVGTRDGRDGPYTSARMLELFRKGDFPPDSTYRREGMKSWSSLAAYEAHEKSNAERAQRAEERRANEQGRGRSRRGSRGFGRSRSRWVYVALGLLFGIFGAHNFYARRFWPGLVELCVFGFVAATFRWKDVLPVGLFVGMIAYPYVLIEVCRRRWDGRGVPFR
jgi:hypothetical protein